MSNSLELREQHAALVKETSKWYNSVKDDAAKPEAEIHEEFDKRMKQADELQRSIGTAERSEKLEHAEAELQRSQGRKTSPRNVEVNPLHTRAAKRNAWKNWSAFKNTERKWTIDSDEIHQCHEHGFDLNNDSVSMSMRSLTTSTSNAPTFTTTSPDITTEMKYVSPILQKVKIITTSNGNTYNWPKGSDVTNVMAIVSQGSGSGISTEPTFSAPVAFGAYTYRYIEQISLEMLEDSIFDIEAWIRERLVERAARTLEKAIVVGTGSSQPTGLVAAVTALDSGSPAVTLAATKKSLYQFSDVYKLFAAVDKAYRDRGTLLINDSSLWDLRNITDTAGRNIWDINNMLAQNGAPDKVAGFNYLISNSIDASNAFSKNLAVFADLSQMGVRLVDNITLTRLNERYRDSGLIGIEVRMRFDCNYLGYVSSIARLATPAS